MKPLSKNKAASYQCSWCSSIFVQQFGQCPNCSEWNKISKIKKENTKNTDIELLQFKDIKPMSNQRFLSNHKEFDRVVGGGLVQDSVTLIGGDPGIGKSTLLLSIMCDLAKQVEALYVSGEESLEQTALRLKRMQKADNGLQFVSSTNIEAILKTVDKNNIKLLVIDSIQTMVDASIGNQAGTISQVRECAQKLTTFAKNNGCTILMIGHVTKDGLLAGPRVLEHLVDTVLHFEGEEHNQFRMLRTIKNRFGAVNELGVFIMDEQGITGVDKPSDLFLSKHSKPVIGSVVSAVRNGQRSLLVEIQVLIDSSYGEYPKRNGQGVDPSRLPMLLAVLSKHSSVQLSGQDIYVNAVGGVKVTDRAIDLAIIGALISAEKGVCTDRSAMICGEIGLLGEVRPINAIVDRINSAEQHGFNTAIIPKGNLANIKGATKIKIVGVEGIKDFISLWL